MHVVDLIEEASGPLRTAGFVVVCSAFALTAAAVAWEGSWIASAAAVWGAVFTASGGFAIRRRRFRTGERSEASASRAREHSGVPAILLGGSTLALGLVLLIGGLVALVGVGEVAAGAAFDRPGLVVTTAGAFVSTVGIALAVSRWHKLDSSTTWWQRLPARVVGVLAFGSGLVLIVLGVEALSAHATWPAFLERVFLLVARILGG